MCWRIININTTAIDCLWIVYFRTSRQRRHLGGWGPSPPPPPPRKKKKRKKERKKEKKRKKREKEIKERGELWTASNYCDMNDCFFQFFNNPVALKNLKKCWPPKKKLKWRPCLTLLMGAAMLCFISRRLSVADKAGSRRHVSVAGSHVPAKPTSCRYRQGKLYSK